MQPEKGDHVLDSQSSTIMLDSFSLQAPQDAVKWLVEQVLNPPATKGDEAPPALKFVGAFTRSTYKRKQAIIVHLIKGFEAIPAPERVKITLIAMRVMEAISALKLKAVQNEQAEKSQPEQTRPTPDFDLKNLVNMIKSGVLEPAALAEMLQSQPADQRESIIASVKAAAVQQGLSEEDVALIKQIAEQAPQDANMSSSASEPESEATHSWSKLSLLLKIAEELPRIPVEERAYLAQAAKVAVLQTGVLKMAKSIIELITELRSISEEDERKRDERKELENIMLTMLAPKKDDLTRFFVHRALAPGGYADQLLMLLTFLKYAYDYAWLCLGLPLLELLLSTRRSSCPVGLWPWLRADAILWLITAGSGFRIYMEYCRIYSKYQSIEEAKLAGEVQDENVPVTVGDVERDEPSGDMELLYSLVDPDTIWKMGIIVGIFLLSLLAGWSAMIVAFFEIFFVLFRSCSFFTVFISVVFDALRFASLIIVLDVVVKLYQEYRAVPLQESEVSGASSYGSVEEAAKPATPFFTG